MRRSSCTIYVGNLPEDVRESEIEDLFYKYGRILDIDLKLPPRPPVYCFIEFEDARDAEDAIRGRDGYKFDGHRLRVEIAHGGRGSSSADLYSSYSSGGGNGRSSGLYRRSGYRVIVRGLPASASWQDLKDHMRRAGDVCFAQVYHKSSGTVGVVDYTNYEDMKYAIRKLDDSEFRNPFSRSYLRVKEDRGYESSYSRSRSRSYSRSPSYGYRSRRSHGRSYSPSYSRSYSRSRSHSSNRSRSYDSRQSYGRSRSESQSVYSRSQSRSVSRSRSYSPSPRSRSHSPIRQSSSRSVSWSRSPSRSRSRSHSHMRKFSPSHSRSGSPCHVKGQSSSASQSRSRSESESPLVKTNSK